MNVVQTFLSPFAGSVVERLGWVLVHSLWQFTLLALLAWLVVRAMRRSSATARYGVLLVAIAAVVGAPVVTWMLVPTVAPDTSENARVAAAGPESDDKTTSRPDAPTPANGSGMADKLDSEIPPQNPTASKVVSEPVPVALPKTPAAIHPAPSWSHTVTQFLQPWLAWIVVGWCLGVVLCSVRPLLGWHMLRRLRREGVSPVSDDVQATLHRVSERLGLRRTVHVLQSTLAQVPVMIGYVRPTILLPVSLLSNIPVAQLEAILAHELAHVRRHDFVVNLLQTLIETIFFYHPAVWWLSRQIRIEREHCCDDIVVELLGNRVEYGRALVAIEEMRGQNTVLALGATDGSLLSRVRRILGVTTDRSAVSLVGRLPAALAGLALIGMVFALTMAAGLAAKDDKTQDDASVKTIVSEEEQGIAGLDTDWPLFRGNALQSGVANGALPNQLQIRWKIDLKKGIESTAAIVKDTVYVGCYDNHLHAIDLATGKHRWKTNLGGGIKAPPSVFDGKVFVGDEDGKFHCVDAKSGKPLWEFETGGEISGGATFADGDKVIVGSQDATLYCLSIKSGEVLWKLRIDGPINGSAAVANGQTFLAGCDGHLHIIDVKTGKVSEKVELSGQSAASAAVIGDRLYVGNMNNELQGIDLKKKQVLWSYAPKRGQPFFSSPAVTGRVVIVGSRDRRIHAVDRVNGASLWTFQGDGRFDSSPVVAGKSVYVGTTNGTLYVLDEQKGIEVHSLSLGQGITASPAVARGCLVIGTTDGLLYCLGKKAGQEKAGGIDEDILTRMVSLTAKAMPLNEALAALAREAKVELQLEVDALKKVGLDTEMPVTVTIKNEPLADALGSLINWNRHFGAMREVRGGKLIITTLEAYQAGIERNLPDWLKVHYNRGLLAKLDGDRNVVSLTTGEIMSDELLGKLKTLPKLRELDIGSAKAITPAGLTHLADISSLEKLTVSSLNHNGKGLGDAAIQHLASLKSLRELALNNCGTTDAGIRLLENMPQLTHLSLYSEPQLTDAAITSIAKMKQLKTLSLNSYVGTEQGWMRFSKEATRKLVVLQDLEHLHLVGQEISPETLQFPRLKSLSVGTAAVDDDCAARISKCRDLQSLELVYTNITDDGLSKIAELPELSRLNLDTYVITDAGIKHVGKSTTLQHISLRASRLTDESLEHLAEIKTLKRIDLSGSGEPGVNPGRRYTLAGVQRLKAISGLRVLWLSNFDSAAGFLGLKELGQLRELTLMMANIRDEELDALEEAMPNTRINAISGGYKMRVPRKGPPAKAGADIQGGPEEARKDIESGHLKYMLCGQPQAHDALFADVLQKEHKITLVVIGCDVPEPVRKRTDGYNEVILNHLEKLGKKDIIRETEKKARKQWEQDRAKSSLLEKSIEDFNLKAKSDPIYKEQPRLTKKEVIDAIRAAQKSDFPKITDALYKSFKEIADKENLPATSVFHAHNDLVDCGDCVVDAWKVRLALPNGDGGMYSFTIRTKQLGQTRSLAAEADRIEKMLRDAPALPGRYRLEDRVKELRKRAAELKEKKSN